MRVSIILFSRELPIFVGADPFVASKVWHRISDHDVNGIFSDVFWCNPNGKRSRHWTDISGNNGSTFLSDYNSQHVPDED